MRVRVERRAPPSGPGVKVPVVPADRFEPAASNAAGEDVELWVPPSLSIAAATAAPEPVHRPGARPGSLAIRSRSTRSIPASGNMTCSSTQFWLGPARAWQVVRFWVDCEGVHLSSARQRVKSLRSRFSITTTWPYLHHPGAVPADRLRCPPATVREATPDARIIRGRADRGAGTVSLGSRVRGGRGDPRRPQGLGSRLWRCCSPPDAGAVADPPNPLEPGEAVCCKSTPGR